MRSGRLSVASRGTGSLSRITVALLLCVVVSAAQALGGGSSTLPGDSLAITGSSTGVLAAARAATADPSWRQGFHLTGYVSQLFGMWQDPPSLRSFTRSRNNLAVARTLLQIDGNFQLNESNSFFMRTWFTYDPP